MPAARTNYVTKEELGDLVREQRDSGRVSERLGAVLAQIAGGVWDRYRFTEEREDFVQDVVLHLLQNPLQKADLQKHVFNFFTTCAIRYGGKLRDKQFGDRRRFYTYAAECAEAGQQIPDKWEQVRSRDDDEYRPRTTATYPDQHTPEVAR